MIGLNIFSSPQLEHWRMYPAKWQRPFIPWKTVQYGGIRVSFKPHLDGGGGEGGGQILVDLLKSLGMPKQPRLFEWCAGPGFIGFSMLSKGMCETLCLADINPEAVKACRRTIASAALADKVSTYVSDNLSAIPASEQWSLVIGNPPHFADDFVGELRTYDPDWSIHRGFFQSVLQFLAPGGVIVLFENNKGSTPDTFRAMADDCGLDLIWSRDASPVRTDEHQVYFIAFVRRGDAVPAWLR